jgi:hypothetical protein
LSVDLDEDEVNVEKSVGIVPFMMLITLVAPELLRLIPGYEYDVPFIKFVIVLLVMVDDKIIVGIIILKTKVRS